MLFFLISFYIFLSSLDRKIYSSGYYASILPILITFLLAILIIFAVRTTVVTWITVLVLLAFVGKRRRVLVREGREITSDVAMYLVRVVVKERSLVGFACATFISLITMATAAFYNSVVVAAFYNAIVAAPSPNKKRRRRPSANRIPSPSPSSYKSELVSVTALLQIDL
ncbi:hypothetical protein BUALT_Bualt02G0136600 [Buddleja alternifolia]|uniref:Uncharacterized protein n=1 Tax=Buddleja alternifolia TaxID=168488 RepID=A0AAV6YB17_9LAMI|nr:hypothetical protein BUALT_Bualt02G0136600 [Buddleja alternifolia]